MRLVLDSAFVIDHMRGVPEAVSRYRALFEAGDEPFANEIVVCEVRAGTLDEELPSFHAFFEPVEFIQPGPEVAQLAGAWRNHARRQGYQLSLADALIAAAAEAIGGVVLTRNVKDFELTPARVETY